MNCINNGASQGGARIGSMATFEELIRRYPTENFSKGETLILKDEIPRATYVIETGLVKAYTITPDGAERQVALHRKGEDLPIGYGLGLTQKSQYFYEAYSNCQIRLIPKSKFVQYVKSDVDDMFQRYVQLDGILIVMLARVSALEHPRAGDKVAFMLQQMAEQVGTKLRPYKSRLKLVVTQQEIADALGLTRETTGMELKKLELKNIITHSRNTYVLYMERLRRYLEDR